MAGVCKRTKRGRCERRKAKGERPFSLLQNCGGAAYHAAKRRECPKGGVLLVWTRGAFGREGVIFSCHTRTASVGLDHKSNAVACTFLSPHPTSIARNFHALLFASADIHA